jgi:Superinfection immunity protein
VVVVIFIIVYFAPTIIALVRHKLNPLRTYLLLNVFLGWTVFIWIVLLVKSLTKDKLNYGIPSRRGYAGKQVSKQLSIGELNTLQRAKAVQAVKSGGNLETYDAMVLEALKQNSKRLWGKDDFMVEVDVAKQIMREFKHSNQSEADKQLVESIAQELGLYYNRLLHPVQALKDDVQAIGDTVSGIKDVTKPTIDYMIHDPKGYTRNATQTTLDAYKQPLTRKYWAQLSPNNLAKTQTDYEVALCEQNKQRELDAIKSVLG